MKGKKNIFEAFIFYIFIFNFYAGWCLLITGLINDNIELTASAMIFWIIAIIALMMFTYLCNK